MYNNIFRFELGYLGRQPVFYIGWLLIAAITAFMVYFKLNYSTESSAAIRLNDPVSAAKTLNWLISATFIIPVLLVGNVAFRDKNSRMDGIIKASPVSYKSLLIIRFLSIFLLCSAIYISLGLILELVANLFGFSILVAPPNLIAYVNSYSLLLLPNILIFTALTFAILLSSGRLIMGYILYIALFVITHILGSLDLGGVSRNLCIILDPGGTCVLRQDIALWTQADYQSRSLELSDNLLFNRILWLFIAIFALTVSIISAGRKLQSINHSSKGNPPLNSVFQDTPLQKVTPGQLSVLSQFMIRFRYEASGVLSSWLLPFMLALLVGTGLLVLNLPPESIDKAFFPISSFIAPRIMEGTVLIGVILILLLAGELVWKEKKHNVSELLYSTPASNTVFYGAKFAVLMLVALICTIVSIAAGIIYELNTGPGTVTSFSIYLVIGFFECFIPVTIIGIFALFLQTLSPGKAIGYILSFIWMVLEITVFIWGYEDSLYHLAAIPFINVSEMNGVDHYLNGPVWFAIYWGSIHIFLALVTVLIWRRGTNAQLGTRFKNAWKTLKPASVLTGAASLLVAIVSGGVIYWNTHILHEFITTVDAEKYRVEYEKAFIGQLNQPNPSVTDVDLVVDLDTEKRTLHSRGKLILENKTDRDITLVRVQFYYGTDVKSVSIKDATLRSRNPRFRDYVFELKTALTPGDKTELNFSAFGHETGFYHKSERTPSFINSNGTSLINSLFVPWIGIETSYFLDDDIRRQEHGLKERSAIADKYYSKNRSLYVVDSHGVNLNLVISTGKDQQVLAPGVLKSEKLNGNKRYFHFNTDFPITNQWSILTGRYEVHRDKWDNVNLAMYYDKNYRGNVEHVIDTFRASLEYFTDHFGPYQYKQLSMAIYPYGVPAISYPATIAYPEGSYIIESSKKGSITALEYVVAHEVAHQWWAHQLAPAKVPGATFLSETLAEYSALMVMEKKYGKEFVRFFLKRDLDRYLKYRSTDGGEEPLVRARNNQEHIAYHKGAMAMYALRESIGVITLNTALKQFLEAYRYKGAPYPTPDNLLEMLRKAAGKQHDGLITDLFEKITFWEFSAITANSVQTQDGRWKTTALFKGSKFYADAFGSLKPAKIGNLVRVGLYRNSPSQSGYQAISTITWKNHYVDKEVFKVEFISEQKPLFVGINSNLKFIEQRMEDNFVPVH